MTAIFGASKHPVLVKKIKIRSWPLRSEIQAIIQNELAQQTEAANENSSGPIEIQLKNYFQSLRSGIPQSEGAVSSIADPNANILPFPGAESGEQVAATPEQAGAAPPMDDLEKAMAEAMQGSAEAPSAEVPSDPNNQTPAALDQAAVPTEQPAVSSASTRQIFPPVAATRASPAFAEGVTGFGSAFLNDLTMLDICFFSSECYRPGQTVVIEFLIPMHFMVTVEILQCRRYNMRSRVISNERGEFRIYAKLIFLHPGERTYLRRFLKSIEPEIKVVARPKKEAESGGGLEDLADLGL